VIPGFFERLKFKVVNPKADLPFKDDYDCSNCSPEKCVAMVRNPL
jgi:hypothetical protein